MFLEKTFNYFYKSSFILLPGKCIECGGKGLSRLDLCAACLNNLPWYSDKGCSICGKCLPEDGFLQVDKTRRCGSCLQSPPPFNRILPVFNYSDPVSKFVLQLKFNNRLLYSRVLSDLLIDKLLTYYKGRAWPQIIIPMPLHKKRLQQRGFNQALEIIRPVARKLNIPLERHIVQRVKHTNPQAGLSENKRLLNIRGAFDINAKWKKSLGNLDHVAIFDDVVTTGSTVTALSRVLRRHGVNEIDVWCCAKTVKKD